jgi:hypothetical protein
MGDWSGREYLCESVATTDEIVAYVLVMGAFSDEGAPLLVPFGTRTGQSRYIDPAGMPAPHGVRQCETD